MSIESMLSRKYLASLYVNMVHLLFVTPLRLHFLNPRTALPIPNYRPQAGDIPQTTFISLLLLFQATFPSTSLLVGELCLIKQSTSTTATLTYIHIYVQHDGITLPFTPSTHTNLAFSSMMPRSTKDYHEDQGPWHSGSVPADGGKANGSTAFRCTVSPCLGVNPGLFPNGTPTNMSNG